MVADNNKEATAMVKDPYAPTTDTVNPWNTAVVSSSEVRANWPGRAASIAAEQQRLGSADPRATAPTTEIDGAAPWTTDGIIAEQIRQRAIAHQAEIAQDPMPVDVPIQAPNIGTFSCAAPRPTTDALIEYLFTYVPPGSRIHSAMLDINDAAKALAYVISAYCPAGERRADVLNLLHSAVVKATAIIN